MVRIGIRSKLGSVPLFKFCLQSKNRSWQCQELKKLVIVLKRSKSLFQLASGWSSLHQVCRDYIVFIPSKTKAYLPAFPRHTSIPTVKSGQRFRPSLATVVSRLPVFGTSPIPAGNKVTLCYTKNKLHNSLLKSTMRPSSKFKVGKYTNEWTIMSYFSLQVKRNGTWKRHSVKLDALRTSLWCNSRREFFVRVVHSLYSVLLSLYNSTLTVSRRLKTVYCYHKRC